MIVLMVSLIKLHLLLTTNARIISGILSWRTKPEEAKPQKEVHLTCCSISRLLFFYRELPGGERGEELQYKIDGGDPRKF